MINQKPDITESDLLYIEQIISNNMSKKLQIIRDDKKNIKIVLENKDFLGVDREELPLSTGESNFLSLTFELFRSLNIKFLRQLKIYLLKFVAVQECILIDQTTPFFSPLSQNIRLKDNNPPFL